MTAEINLDNLSSGIVFDIQRYSIHDGPGIRTTVFLKGCALRCFWCQNPESQAGQPQIMLNKSGCILCGRCVEVCDTNVNTLAETSVRIDRTKCIGCEKCVKVCPAKARSLKGNKMTVNQVMEVVLKDKAMYDNSHGGVTISGGDPSMQPAFARQLLRRAKELGLHTAVETCGYTSWPILSSLLEPADLVLFDIKCLDNVKHIKATGKENSLILENARKLAREKPIRVRTPLVPGFNDSIEEVRALLQFVKKELGLTGSDIELLRYNKLGEAKYDKLDEVALRPSMEPQTDEYFELLKAVIREG